MPDFVQRSPAQDPNALPAHPVVTQGATQTNANTGGGMVPAASYSEWADNAWHDPRNLNAPAPVYPPPVAMAPRQRTDPAQPGPTIGDRVQAGLAAGFTPTPGAPPFIPSSVSHAAAAAMQYLVGHAEGVSKGANAAAVGAAPAPARTAPGEGANPDNRISQEVIRPIEGDARVGAGNAPVYGHGAPAGFPGYRGDGVSVSPGPVGYVGPAGGGHFLSSAAGAMGRGQFAQAFAGVPAFLVIEALQAMKPPAMDDQAKAASVDMARRAAATGNPQAQAYLRDLLEAEALGPIQPTFRGMHQQQQ